MALLRMPKTIRWVGICAILLLVLLTVYRGFIFMLFQGVFTITKAGIGEAFWYGLRYDARIVGIITLFMFFTGFWPGKHFYKSDGGKKLALWFYGLLMIGVLIFYMADIAYLQHFNQRLNGSLISDLAKDTEKGKLYKTQTAWLPMIVIMAVVVVLFVFLINKLHRSIGRAKGTDNRPMRIGWQIICVLFCVLAIYGSLSSRPLNIQAASAKLTPPALQLAINPFEALLNSLPARRYKINTW